MLINESLILLIGILILNSLLLNREKRAITIRALFAIDLFLNILCATYHHEVALTGLTHHRRLVPFTVLLGEQLLIDLFEYINIVSLIISVHEWGLHDLALIYSIKSLIHQILLFMLLLFCILIGLWVSFLYFFL